MMIRILIIFIFFITSACQENLLSGFGSSSEDEARYMAAKEALNNQQYDAAIDIITNQMTIEMQSQAKVKEVLMSSYGGKCGWNLLDYTEALSQSSTGTAISIMMGPFVGETVSIVDCIKSLETLESIGPAEARTINQNLFGSIAGMVLVGAATRSYVDKSPALGNGVSDVNICDDLTNDQIDDIILGFGHLSKNFAAVAEDLIGSYSDLSMSDLIDICNDYGVTCDVTSKSQINGAARLFFRNLLNTQEFGVGSFITGGNPNAIAASCL